MVETKRFRYISFYCQLIPDRLQKSTDITHKANNNMGLHLQDPEQHSSTPLPALQQGVRGIGPLTTTFLLQFSSTSPPVS